VLRAARIMNATGIPTRLTIVGCTPFKEADVPPFVELAGFLSCMVPAERKRLEALYCRSHFLVLPSRAEAFGIVLCEAAAFGVPSFASATGGIPSIIDDRVTGGLLPPDADAAQYAAGLGALFEHREHYRAVAMAAYARYRRQLNWDVACEAALALLPRHS
jgi:glycosyltransferase involved in cell wall biosynthesis